MNPTLPPPPLVNEKGANHPRAPFPIVGIGASAGGLEALEQFFGNVPIDSGMAYVVIQHLDPTQKGMLPELLQRICKIEVLQAKDRMKVSPNHVYVIPPNKSMSILNGKLLLFEPIEARGLRLPVDFFLRSLADERRELSAGVILSGMGSDGCSGLKAIKEKNGIVLAQEPSSAKFDSMPRNAIDSVLIDVIAPASELPFKLVELFGQLPHGAANETETKDRGALDKIILLLRAHTGNDFSLYKKSTLYRRIERRMSIHNIDRISKYVQCLQENPKEADILFKELLIGVTNFFRDSAVWQKLKEKVIPDLLSTHENGELRAWVTGCSTGEEAYSLAIVFKEAVENLQPHGRYSLKIFATDLDNDAIETARKGLFHKHIDTDVSPSRLKRFFISNDDGYRVSPEIREMVVFAQHNLIMHPPFTKVDIVCCRNLLIYLDSDLQKKILSLFHYSLSRQGYLVLGASESLGAQSLLFEPIDTKLKLYKRATAYAPPELFPFSGSFSPNAQDNFEKMAPKKTIPNIQILANQLMLECFSPPGVLVNSDGDILYISGRTGKYLEPPVGKANLNIFAMLREGLRNEFPGAFRKAMTRKETTVLPNIRLGTDTGEQPVNVSIKWIEKPDPLRGLLMVVFSDAPMASNPPLLSPKKSSKSHRELELENELRHTREAMQGTVEEMQTAQEELKSTNEELQSTNEELQSTNEELTTSKEEMQSLNEELQTVNAELQAKVDDFSRVNNDMKNLLNSTDIATLFLDKALNIRRYTNQATKIFKLIKTDIGRPFTDLVTELVYPELATDALDVLKTLIFIEKQIPARDGRWFLIRIMPYRTFDDRIDGLVITFINISDQKTLEAEMIQREQLYRFLLDFGSFTIVVLGPDGDIKEFNQTAEKTFGKKRGEVLNLNFAKTFVPPACFEKVEAERVNLQTSTSKGTLKMDIVTANSGTLEVEWIVQALPGTSRLTTGIMLITNTPTDKHDKP